MVASFPAVRMAEMVKVEARLRELRELRVKGEIGPVGQGSIGARAVCRALHLLITEVTYWKDKVDKIPRGASWRIRLGRTGHQCYLVSLPEELTCSADVVVAVLCLRTGEEIRPPSVES